MMRRQFQSLSQHFDLPNIWDGIAFVIIAALFILCVYAGQQMATPYAIGEPLPISLSPSDLPNYALRTVIRMGLALLCSLFFSFLFGTLAAKYKRAESIIIPAIDILQSVPILGFLSITVVGFIKLFPGSMLGPECAAIFAIFTSQAWNMALSIYQSLKMVPQELKEVAKMYQLTPWQTYWRVEIPFAVPSLLWNTMISLSGGWFFVVACEAISVSNQNIMLPGMGSYIALAIDRQDLGAVGYAILTMLLVILLYDQLLFRPLLKWSEKFTSQNNQTEHETSSWIYTVFQRTRVMQWFGKQMRRLVDAFIHGIPKPKRKAKTTIDSKRLGKILSLLSISAVFIFFLGGLLYTWQFISNNLSLKEVMHVAGLGLITGTRVMVMISLCSLLWIPVGVWVGLRPNVAQVVQPIAQFFAAFPANLFFPLFVIYILKFQLNVEIWTTPLMILGTQWYILFNVIAGTSAIPKDLILAAKNLGVKGPLWWRRIALPAVFPYYITGALAAAGGAWNASIIAEVVNWGDTTLVATGLGAYITQYTEVGDFPRIALGIGIMCIYVILLNRFFWQRLYNYAIERYQVEYDE